MWYAIIKWVTTEEKFYCETLSVVEVVYVTIGNTAFCLAWDIFLRRVTARWSKNQVPTNQNSRNTCVRLSEELYGACVDILMLLRHACIRLSRLQPSVSTLRFSRKIHFNFSLKNLAFWLCLKMSWICQISNKGKWGIIIQ